MDLHVGGAELPGALDVAGQDVLAAELHRASDNQQGFEFVRNGRLAGTLLHLQDELVIAAKMISGHCAMNGLTEKAIVPRGNVSGDEFALARRKRTWPAQQDFRQLVQWLRRLRTKSHGPQDTRQSFRKLNVRHRLHNSFGCVRNKIRPTDQD